MRLFSCFIVSSSTSFFKNFILPFPSPYVRELKLLVNAICSFVFVLTFSKGAGDYADQLNKKSRIKAAHHSKRAAQRKLKRKFHIAVLLVLVQVQLIYLIFLSKFAKI